MISPYKGRFTITQAYKGSAHDGFDMYGVDSKNIYSTVTGTVTHAGWEDAGNPSKGFGLYVSILRDGTDQKYYFGHLSQICSNVYEGARIYYGQQIGVEGSTGNSTGSHCHYACRSASDSRTPYNISSISGIPNVESGTFYSDNPGVVSGFDGSGSSTPSSITQQYMVNGFWNDLRGSLRTTMHGIKLPTAGKPYYLYYRTYNTGHGWYPFVTSEENDYAGSPGKNIEALECHVYSSSGVKLHNQYVIMYRAFANGTWLPWVSNAPKETMIFLQNKYSLAGDLDVYSCDAGLPGSGIPIEGLDFRIYENVYGSGEGGGDVSGTGGSDGLTKKFMQNGTWKELKNTTWVTSMDGVELKTNETDFYLKYQTYNAIYNGWYPWVTSEENDYAGSSGKPIQAIDIRVCDRNGNHMHDTHAVMYRAHVNGRWLPWVSNASPDIMRRLQSQYNLGGELDTGSAYAGIYGETINQLEIRLYKNVGTSSGSSGSGSSGATAPSGGGGTKIYIDAGHGGQYPGACGGGYQEKDLTLQIALAERRYFMALGYNVMLCRDDDTTSELAERSGAANAWPADIFISNHLNSFDRTARGCEVYHALSGGASKVYAEAVQRALVNQIGFIDRGAKSLRGDDGRDYYHVIRETNMPAIMIESGFIDNDQDRTLIVNNIDKIAKAVVDAIHSANPNKPSSGSSGTLDEIQQENTVNIAWYRKVIDAFRLPEEFGLQVNSSGINLTQILPTTPPIIATFRAGLLQTIHKNGEVTLHVTNGQLDKLTINSLNEIEEAIKKVGSFHKDLSATLKQSVYSYSSKLGSCDINMGIKISPNYITLTVVVSETVKYPSGKEAELTAELTLAIGRNSMDPFYITSSAAALNAATIIVATMGVLALSTAIILTAPYVIESIGSASSILPEIPYLINTILDVLIKKYAYA